MAGQSDVTTATKDSLNESLVNSFDASTVNQELGAQVEITMAFGVEAPKAVAEFAETKTKAYLTAQKAVTMLTEDLADTQDPDKKAYIAEKLKQAEQHLKASEQDYNNWKEGGAYRVAAHTVIGALGAGSLEGALTTGSIAASAPVINDIENKITKALIEKGINEQTAKSLSGNLTTLTLASAGITSGLDTASTATAVNVDANNRQLHPVEADIIRLLAKDYAQKKGISEAEARKRLTRGALYNIDAGWKQTIDFYLSDTPDKIAQYQEAYAYIHAVKPSDLDAYNWKANLTPKPEEKILYDENGLIIETLDTIIVTANAPDDPEEIDRLYYIGTANNSFTVLPEDFANHRIFFKKSFNDVNTLSLLLEDIAIQDPRTYGRTLDTAQEVYNAKAEGSNQGVRNVVTSVWEGLQAVGKAAGNAIIHPIESSKKAGSAIVNAIKAIPQIPDKMSGAYEDFTYKRYEENLAIMQGRGLEAKHEFAASTTASGVTIGIGAAGVVKASTPVVKVLSPDVPDVKASDVARVDNNINADNPSFGNAAVRDFTATPNHPVVHRAENINAGQVTDRDGLQRVDDTKGISDNQVAENLRLQSGRQPDRWGTQRPAWKNGTLVTDHVLTEPRKFQMVIDERQYNEIVKVNSSDSDRARALGGWATDTPVTTVSDVRNKLAVPEEWKSGNLYVVEFTAKPGTKVREGTVGDMWSTETEQRLPGGGHQVEFKDHPAASPEQFEVDKNSIREIR